MAERNQNWDLALKAMSDGGKLVWSYHQIVLFARPGQGHKAESALRDLWRARGFELSLPNTQEGRTRRSVGVKAIKRQMAGSRR